MVQIERVKRRLTRKATALPVADLGGNAFEGYASVFGVTDGAGDMVMPGDFSASLRQRTASGVRMLYQHFTHEPIGVWDEIAEDDYGLYVRGHLVFDVERARDVAALLREGALSGLSIGFKTQRATRDAGGAARRLTQIDLWEISVVTFPLLEAASVIAIGEKGDALAKRRLAQAFRKTASVLRAS